MRAHASAQSSPNAQFHGYSSLSHYTSLSMALECKLFFYELEMYCTTSLELARRCYRNTYQAQYIMRMFD